MRREVYERPKNEIEQQFAQHNLEKDMAQDYEASTRVVSKQHIKSLQAENRGLAVFLILIIGIFALALWLY